MTESKYIIFLKFSFLIFKSPPANFPKSLITKIGFRARYIVFDFTVLFCSFIYLLFHELIISWLSGGGPTLPTVLAGIGDFQMHKALTAGFSSGTFIPLWQAFRTFYNN